MGKGVGENRAYNFAIRDQAARLYIEQGLTYEAIKAQTGVSTGQLKRWGKKEGWKRAAC